MAAGTAPGRAGASHVGSMLAAHPRKTSEQDAVLVACIEACIDCASSCVSCADACLAEPNVAELTACIRLNQDCANICDATARVLERQNAPDREVIQAIVQACATACRKCAAECGKHAQHMEHCSICADVCRSCQQACEQLLTGRTPLVQ